MANSILRQGAKLVLAILSLSTAHASNGASQDETAVQTIVFIRHGEKPDGGFGQLTCQGLNRALALAPTIARSFGKPDAIFAPNPSHPKRMPETLTITFDPSRQSSLRRCCSAFPSM